MSSMDKEDSDAVYDKKAYLPNALSTTFFGMQLREWLISLMYGV